MKRKLIVAATAALLLSSCSSNIGCATLMSADPIDIQNMSNYREDTTVFLEGESSGWYMLIPKAMFSPMTMGTYEEALRDALSKDPNQPVALTNVQMSKYVAPPYGLLFGKHYMRLRGNPVYKK